MTSRRATRVVKGELHTAVQTWTREPNHTIMLIAVSHVGEVSYFRTIERIVASHPSATVHYDRLVRDNPSPPLTDRERVRLDASRRWNKLALRWAAEVADLGTRNGLASEEWHNVDVDEVDIVRMSGRRPMARLRVPGLRVVIDHDPVLTQRQRRVLGHVARVLLVRIAPWSQRLMRPMARRAVVHWRTVHAMSQALRAVHDGRVIVVWDTAHLPGMAKLLKHNDFRLTSTRWIRAVGRTDDWREDKEAIQR